MKTRYVLSILCVFTITLSSASVYATWQIQEEKKIKTDSEVTTISNIDGFETSIPKEKTITSYDDGYFKVKNNFIICSGNAKIKDKETKFNGIFKEKHFALKISAKEKPYLILGKYKLDENREDFQGLWIWNGFKEKTYDKGIGWIKGTIN